MMYYNFVSECGKRDVFTHDQLIALVGSGACLTQVDEVPLTWMLTVPSPVNGEQEVLGIITRMGGICN